MKRIGAQGTKQFLAGYSLHVGSGGARLPAPLVPPLRRGMPVEGDHTFMVIRRALSIILWTAAVSASVLAPLHGGQDRYPSHVRGLYLNAYRAGDQKYMTRVLDTFGGLINALVIDIKDTHGYLSYRSELPVVDRVGAQGTVIKDIRSFLAALHRKGYYVIGRIVVFRDSRYARYKNSKYGVKVAGTGKLWRDENRFVWVDPFSEEAWKYNVAIAEEAAKMGFDEVQFDYVRFPSLNGNSEMPYFPFGKKMKREDAILKFLSMAKEKLSPYGTRISIVLFGYTTWRNHLPGEAQHLYEMGKRVDVVYPMLYPSHFADDFLQHEQKEKRTYDIVYRSALRGDSLLRFTDTRLVAYLQGFTWKQSTLGEDYIAVQMQAAEDAGSDGWIVWNAKGEYAETFHSLVNKQIKVHEPSGNPRFPEIAFNAAVNEKKPKRFDDRGIEAVLPW